MYKLNIFNVCLMMMKNNNGYIKKMIRIIKQANIKKIDLMM